MIFLVLFSIVIFNFWVHMSNPGDFGSFLHSSHVEISAMHTESITQLLWSIV
ncbi:hypothetical protein K438DRAFT_1882856 [Mycena galopus ATCC 62051]|nr:hypothetical protein K438DRAFT_1882856 [Mycena galopus ATCC 62051]